MNLPLAEPTTPWITCPRCGTQIAPSLLLCPGCKRLVHAEELKQLASRAEQLEESDGRSAALTTWRQALDLLPPGTRQHEAVRNRIDALSRRITADGGQLPVPEASGGGSAWKKTAAGVGIGGAILSILSKGKLLFLGLTKAGTLFSMLLSFGVYWTAWGWKFALGLVASIYVHEMGHVYMLRRYGIRSGAPMFIPGFGALVRLKQYPVNPIEDARVGLAGPLWGLGATVATYAAYFGTGWQALGGIARAGAWINLLNLIPIGPLDGGRGMRSLVRAQRWFLAILCGAMWATTHENLLILVGIAAALNALSPGAEEPDHRGFLEYAGLIILLALLCAGFSMS